MTQDQKPPIIDLSDLIAEGRKNIAKEKKEKRAKRIMKPQKKAAVIAFRDSREALNHTMSHISLEDRLDAFKIEALVCVEVINVCKHCDTRTSQPHGLFLKLTHPQYGEHDKKVTPDEFAQYAHLPREVKYIESESLHCGLCFDNENLQQQTVDSLLNEEQ